MDYKLELQNNNIDLQAILESIKELPDAPEGGADTSDATLTSGDQLLEGVTAYGADGKVTGTIPVVDVDDIAFPDYATIRTFYDTIQITGQFASDTFMRQNSTVGITIPPEHLNDLGDAAEMHVVAGRTFTSEAGLKLTGSLEVHSYYISDFEPDASIGEDGDLWLVRGE